MDAFTQLALIAKARRVFETEDTFLSFPALSPIAYAPEELAFAAPGAMTAQSLGLMSEFARLANAIPRGPIAPQEEDEYLWDVYEDVLQTAHLAQGEFSPADAARYETATRLLYTHSADGLPCDSDAYKEYKQHRDAHIAALEEYRNGQLSAESSDDEGLRTQWREAEPRLREEVDRCEQLWNTHGRKGDIEEALQVEQACAARAPSLVWNDWKTSFLADLDTQTDTSLINFAPTSLAPYDFVDDLWPSFTLTMPEMQRLAREAPPELRELLGSTAPEGLRGVSFEYRSVAVTRPWFRPALFKSRIWRLPEGADVLSAGTAALDGRCPAYISAIVFARHIRVQTRQPVPPRTPGGVVHRLPADPRVARRPRPAVREHRDGAPDRRATSPDPRVVVLARQTGPRRPVRGATASRPRPTVHVRPAGSTAVRVNRAGFASRRPRTPPAAQPAAAVPAAAPAQDLTPELTVLAFVCKRLSRCPDPDPALSW
jgi:hypothetical protein